MKVNLSPEDKVTIVSVSEFVIKEDLSMVQQIIDYMILDSKTKEILWTNPNYNPSHERKQEIMKGVFEKIPTLTI